MAEEAIIAYKPHVRVWNDWRGGVLLNTSDPCSIRLQAEENILRTKTCALALVPVGARSLDARVACRVSGTNPDNYVIAEVVGSHQAAGDPPGTPGVVPFEIRGISRDGGEKPWWWRS